MNLFPFLSLSSFQEHIKVHQKTYVESIEGSSASLLVQAAYGVYPILLITSGKNKEDYLADFDCLLETKPLLFPSWETAVEEQIDPSPDIIGKRMDT